MSLKKSLIKNSVASVAGKVTVLLVRLLQVPLFITALGVAEYGHWLVLSSIPAWLVISNLGFGSVAANEMSICVASGEIKEANRIFSTALGLVGFIAIVGTLIIGIIIYFLPLESFWKSSYYSDRELKWSILWLSLSVFISFSAEIYGGRFRAANKAHQSMLVSGFRSWIELGGFFFVLHYTRRFDLIALVSLSATIVYALIKSILSRRAIPALHFSFVNIHFPDVKKLFGKGLAFQAFPMGNALLFQGNILVIQSVLGPVAVVLFSTARTLVRSINQLFEMINQVIWPQFSLLFGAGDFDKARRLHRLAVLASFCGALICIVPLYWLGIPIYKLWTGKAIALDQTLLFLFLLPVCFNALWYTSSVVHLAFNKHEGLAIRYLIACTISLLACFILAHIFGIKGAAVSTVFADLVLIPYVFVKSLALTQDNWRDFINGIINDIRLFIKSPSHFYKKRT